MELVQQIPTDGLLVTHDRTPYVGSSRVCLFRPRTVIVSAETGELAPDKDREFRAVMSAINFGLVQHSIESTPEAHEECIRGFIDLFNGELIKAKKPRRKAKAKAKA